MASKPYRPSNGTEGMGFIEVWCDRCIREPLDPDSENKCVHLTKSFFEDYNGVWFVIDGKPTCTAFKSREEYNRNRKRYAKKDPRQKELFG